MPKGLIDYWLFGIFDAISDFFKGNPQNPQSTTSKSLAYGGSHSLTPEPLIDIDPLELWKRLHYRETMTGETKIGNPTSPNPTYFDWHYQQFREERFK